MSLNSKTNYTTVCKFSQYSLKEIHIYRGKIYIFVIFDTLYSFMYLRSKHQVQTRYFDRISTLNATLFRLTGETVLLGVLACFSSAFLAVRWLQTDGQSGLVQNIGHAALLVGLFQSAKVGVLLGERRQSVSQSGVVGLDVCCVLALVEQDDCFLFVLRQLTHIISP